MDVEAVAAQIKQDRREGDAPFLLVATAGTTSAGVVDPLARLAQIAKREKLWFHVDAAWGGAAALVPELRWVLDGIERADSITFDAHKWLSVPMGAGIFLTRHPTILDRTFRTDTDYMPREAAGMEVVDPYAHSMQWSRRFIGLKVFLSLLVAGWDGYAAAIRHQTAMGDRLRERLRASSWVVINETPLPVVCIVDGTQLGGHMTMYLETFVRQIVSAGKAWISTTRLGNGLVVLRACITNYRTGPEDVDALVADLNAARENTPGVVRG
jgi:glutamate/tyrosine decarboxylase-like PLP-dependent enzyme